jgi:hypothetical protein
MFLYGFSPLAQQPLVDQGLFINEASRSHSLRHTTLGRTPLDEWSARRRDLYLTMPNNQFINSSFLKLSPRLELLTLADYNTASCY